jgi:NTE family protein
VIVLARPEPGAVRSELLRSGGGVSAVVAGGWIDDVPGWIAEMARAGDLRPKLNVSVLTGEMTDSALIQSIENTTGWPARRLDMSLVSVRSLNSGGGTEAATREAVDRLGRQIAGKEVGVALGAGAAKGFAHIGVLEVLQESRVPVDFLVGTSIGAIVGAGFASGLPMDEVQGYLSGADRKLARWTLPFRSIWRDTGLIEMLRAPIPHTRFRDLRIPFATVATDITSGREVVLRRGMVWKAAQASATVPGIFPPVTTRGRSLVDGGLVNPVPGQTVRDLGADIVIAVDLMSPSARSGGTLDSMPTASDALKTRIPNLVEILWRSNEIMQEEVTLRSAATADVTIEPKLGRVRWSDFSKRGRQYRLAGEQAAREKLPEIRALLGAAIAGN